VGRELDIIEHVEHEVVDRHGVPCRICFRGIFLAPGAVKNGLQNRSGLWVRSINHRDSIGIILDDPAALIALHLCPDMAVIIYLEYKRHDSYANAGRALCNPYVRPERGAWDPFSIIP
jgi:hypothetical protein